MSVKAKDVVDAALRLISHVSETGAVSKNREARYFGVATSYLTVLQYELAGYERVPEPMPVTSLEQTLDLSDKTALEIMPVGLAMYFSLIDRDAELYNHFQSSYYGCLIPSIRSAEVPIKECYLSPDDLMMR
jgi:hypothetical protein